MEEQFIEKGSFVVGALVDGERYKNFTIRAQLFRDTLVAMKTYASGDPMLSPAITASQLTIDSVPQDRVTADLVADLLQVDMDAVSAAEERLRKRIAGFSGGDQTAPDADAGTAEGGDSVASGGSDAGTGTAGVAAESGGTAEPEAEEQEVQSPAQ